MTYRRALHVLEERQEARICLGLGRMRRHLAASGDPQEAYRSIHVAGTNGKGSVCAIFDSILRASGYRTGLYTSPHLHCVRERIRVDGSPIPPAAFAGAVAGVLRMERRLRERLTYFELLTAVAFRHFRDARVKVAVIETGLGGRFDATNVTRSPLAAVIPAVDYDHMEWLGHSLAEIAREKAGIFKRGVPAATAEGKSAALEVLRRVAREKGVPLSVLPRDPAWRKAGMDWKGGRQVLRGPKNQELILGMLGHAQARNAALALQTLPVLRAKGIAVPQHAVSRGFSGVFWPGRFEVVRRAKGVLILDGAHNVQAMRHFCDTLKASPWNRGPKTFLLGMLRDKRHEIMVRVLAPFLRGQKVLATRPSSPRGLDPEVLAREVSLWAPSASVSVAPEPSRAIRELDRLDGGGPRVLCVCGSFYLVGEARRVLGLPGAGQDGGAA